VFLDVDPGYGALLARHCARQGIRLPSLKFIISSYEFLSAVHRRQLQQALGVPVFNLYGSTETGHLLMETEHGEMAPSLTTAFLEVLHPDTAGIGTLVVTTLTNHYMPLIRYNIGDLVRVNLQPYHTTYEVHGRAKDALVNTRGQRVTVAQVDQCLAHTTGLIHYQLRQQSADQFTLYVVPETPGTAEPTLVSLRPTLAELLGTDRGLTIEPVEYIPCESSGKFRLCCRI
jgi:phenylacetate-CoA ligase